MHKIHDVILIGCGIAGIKFIYEDQGATVSIYQREGDV